MHSTRLQQLRHHLKDPTGLPLATWANELQNLTDDARHLVRQQREFSQQRTLVREIRCVRSTNPDLPSPALSMAVQRHDRMIYSVDVARRTELRKHLQLISDMADRLTPQKLLSLAQDEVREGERTFPREIERAVHALACSWGEMARPGGDAARARITDARRLWRSMYDTVQALSTLAMDLHDDQLVPFVSRWVNERLQHLHACHQQLQRLETELTHRLEGSGDK